MPHPEDKAARIRGMFNRLAARYDTMNRLMTFGRDRSWCRRVVRTAGLLPGGSLLDVGTGTGAIIRAALTERPDLRCVAADFSLGMMTQGRRRLSLAAVTWCAADALDLPFSADTFDAVTSGYLVRNVSDIDRAFAEQLRVVKPGGRVVCLETSPPPPGPLGPWIRWHMHVVIPGLGRWIGGQPSAYRYLPDSTQAFLTPEALAAVMRKAGLQGVRYRRFMFGTIVIASGRKAPTGGIAAKGPGGGPHAAPGEPLSRRPAGCGGLSSFPRRPARR
jgi:demethylmenaquinone methyltransferase/2-methoxy-6-polyprenyl-1,4-benzoquinol methylase